MNNPYDTIIIGGGAAGLMSAIVAARQKQNVLIIEKNDTVGKKILVTGNGRCNLTNINVSPDKYYGENIECLHSIFNRLSCNDAIKFFEAIGVKLKVEADGRVFPVSNKASTVLDALINEVKRLKVKTNLKERVIKLSKIQNEWEIKTDKNRYQSKLVILTTGGKSYPQLGTTGDGYKIARNLGHKIIEPKQALVPLELHGNWFKNLSGISLDVKLSMVVQKKTLVQKQGEMLFTHFGISGPVVLDLSRSIIDCFTKPHFSLFVNFVPEYKNINGLISFIKAHPKKTLINTLCIILPKKLCAGLLQELKINHDIQVAQITKKELRLLFERLLNWQLQVKGPRPFYESMVTAGGVSVNEVNSKTMESLKAKGLYFAGEILDIDGVSGGYNLQFAWSTGYLAGISASQHR